MPKMLFEVSSVRPNEFTRKTGEEVKEVILGLVDKCPSGYRLGHMVEYVWPERYHEALAPDAVRAALTDKRITFAETRRQEWQNAQRIEGEVLEIDGKPFLVNGKAPEAVTSGAKK